MTDNWETTTVNSNDSFRHIEDFSSIMDEENVFNESDKRFCIVAIVRTGQSQVIVKVGSISPVRVICLVLTILRHADFGGGEQRCPNR